MKKILFLLFAILTAAVPAMAQDTPMLLPVDAAPLAISRDGKEIARFTVEIADDRGERSRGLMFREAFPDDRAMLFVFEETRKVAFWMQNTPRSLDMLFVRENGELASIARDTTPFSTDEVPSAEPVRYVLEINAGLSNRLGIEPGDRVVHPIISSGGE
jgi:uncharacterized membrane protein (UPF0127 family)